MVEPINSNYNNSDYFNKIKPVDTMNSQTSQQNVVEKQEPQAKKNQADTVTISREALEAQRSNAATNNPEEARNKSMVEAQNAAGAGAPKSNPRETMAQSYSISR